MAGECETVRFFNGKSNEKGFNFLVRVGIFGSVK